MSARTVKIGEMPGKEVRVSFAERFRLAGTAWAKSAAYKDKMEALRGPRREAIKLIIRQLPGNEKMSDAALERLAIQHPDYQAHLEAEFHAAVEANLDWVERKAIELEWNEASDKNANYRLERKMYARD